MSKEMTTLELAARARFDGEEVWGGKWINGSQLKCAVVSLTPCENDTVSNAQLANLMGASISTANRALFALLKNGTLTAMPSKKTNAMRYLVNRKKLKTLVHK